MDSDTNVTTDNSVPTTAEGDPISWDGNKAHIEGILADINEWGTRTGRFVALVENRAVVLNNGSLAVESLPATFTCRFFIPRHWLLFIGSLVFWIGC